MPFSLDNPLDRSVLVAMKLGKPHLVKTARGGWFVTIPCKNGFLQVGSLYDWSFAEAYDRASAANRLS